MPRYTRAHDPPTSRGLSREYQESRRMLTRNDPATAPAPATPAAAPALDDLICYFEGQFVQQRDAKVGGMTHAFM